MNLAIVGLDGLSPNTIEHCRGELPVLDRLLTDGAGGALRSTVPAVTFPAWTTFTTGKEPGSHGLYNMTEVAADYSISPTSTNETDGALFDVIDDGVFVNVPATYPRRPRGDAFLVTGSAPTPEAAFPSEVRDWPEIDNYRTNPDTDKKADTDDFVEHMKDIAAARFDVTRRAVKERDPELTFVLFSCTDWLFHHLEPESHEEHVCELMGALEEYLAWFEKHADNLLVMSDHGFERKHVAAYPNKILENEGFVQTTNTSNDVRSGMAALATGIRSITKHSDIVYEFVRRGYNRLSHTDVAQELYEAKELDVEYDNTLAWHTQRGTIFVNDDRFDNPTVSDESEKQSVVDEIVDALSSARHPETGSPLFKRVSRGGEVYGDGRGMRPDVVAEPAEGVILYKTPMQDKIASHTDIFNHRTEGIFTGVGDAFTETEVTADMRDVAPTVLSLLGRSVPQDMDGRVLTELLEIDEPVRYSESIEPGPVGTVESAAEEQLEQRLADLGYME